MKRLKVRSPHWKKKIDMLDQEMAAASTDFVKLNQLVTEKRKRKICWKKRWTDGCI